jgi:hypothetical protein
VADDQLIVARSSQSLTAVRAARRQSRTQVTAKVAGRPVPVYRDRRQSGSQSLLWATHATSYVGDGLDRDGFCKKDPDSYRNEEEAGYDMRPAICFERVCAYQAETTGHKRDRTE